jgi:hypothetical protein
MSQRKYEDCRAVINELQKFMPGFEKTENYFKRVHLYNFLTQNGDLNTALQLAKKSVEFHDEGMENSYSEMYKLFEILDKLKTHK